MELRSEILERRRAVRLGYLLDRTHKQRAADCHGVGSGYDNVLEAAETFAAVVLVQLHLETVFAGDHGNAAGDLKRLEALLAVSGLERGIGPLLEVFHDDLARFGFE